MYQTGFNSLTGLTGMTKEKLIGLNGYRIGLYVARIRINYTQDYVAKVAGLTRSTYSDIERGMCYKSEEPRDCNGIKWVKIADCLNVENLREIMSIWTYDIKGDLFVRSIKEHGKVIKLTYEQIIGIN